MHYCLIINDFRAGGAQKANIDLIKGFISFGHSVTVIAVENRIELNIPIGVPIYILQEIGKKTQGYFGKISLKNKLSREWHRLNKDKRFDTTISRLQFSNEITILAKIPNSHYIIDNSLPEEVKKLTKQNLFKGFRRKYRYIKIYKNKSLLPVSEGIKKDLIEYFKFDKKNINVIYNPIDFETIKELSNEKGSLQFPFKYIIHVARAIGQKRHDLVIDSWKLITSEYKLVLLTDDVEKIKLLVAEREMQSRCIVVPFSKNPYPLMKNARLLVISSDFEGAPLVIPESVLCGTPIISTNCNHGPQEILGPKYESNLAPKNNSIALSKKIIHELSKKKVPMDVNLERFKLRNVVIAYENITSSQSAIFFKTKNIGDSIILSSAINAMPKAFKYIDIVCLPESEAIFRMTSRVNNIYVIPRNKRGLEKWKIYLKLFIKINSKSYNLLIQFSNDWRGALAGRFQNSAYKIAYEHPKRGFFWKNSFTRLLVKSLDDKSAKEIDNDLLRGANVYLNNEAPNYNLTTPKSFLEKNKRLINPIRVDSKEKTILLHTQSRWKFKNLPTKIAADLIDLFHEKKYKVILSGSDQDYISNIKICNQSKIKPILLKNLSLYDTAALIELSDYVITIDSMTLHMASALKKPTVAIFGPTDEKVWGPKGTIFEIAALDESESPKFKCRPCLKSGCNNSKVSDCLIEMSAEYIYQKFNDLVTKTNLNSSP